jgi:hypothetical protein
LLKAFEGERLNRQLFIEPTVIVHGGEGRLYPDILVCNSREVIGIVELKYQPMWSPSWERDFRSLESVGWSATEIEVVNPRYKGSESVRASLRDRPKSAHCLGRCLCVAVQADFTPGDRGHGCRQSPGLSRRKAYRPRTGMLRRQPAILSPMAESRTDDSTCRRQSSGLSFHFIHGNSNHAGRKPRDAPVDRASACQTRRGG